MHSLRLLHNYFIMETSKPNTPHIIWAQRKDKVAITVQQASMQDVKISIPEPNRIVLTGTSEGQKYSLDLKLFGQVNKENSHWVLETRNVFLNLTKSESGPFWPRLTEEKIKADWLKVDWSRYIDEDEEEEEKKGGDFGGFDPSMMNQFADSHDSDDEEENNNKNQGMEDLDEEQLQDCQHLHYLTSSIISSKVYSWRREL